MKKKLRYLLDFTVSSMRWDHANLLCIVPILSDDPKVETLQNLLIYKDMNAIMGNQSRMMCIVIIITMIHQTPNVLPIRIGLAVYDKSMRDLQIVINSGVDISI